MALIHYGQLKVKRTYHFNTVTHRKNEFYLITVAKMLFQIRTLLRVWLPLILIFSFVCYYYSMFLSAFQSKLFPPVFVTLPPSQYKIAEINDRVPSFKLATPNGQKPYADGDRAQATVVNSLDLASRCKEDPSLIVVDVGGFEGEFGLYAAACGCQVFIFEVQPNMADFIRTSIAINNFPTSRVHVIQNAVSDLPSNSRLAFSRGGGTTKSDTNGTLSVSTIRLDDVKWPSQSTIILLKIDVEGFELNVLRSAEKLFREKRIQHLIFEYTAWWTDRAVQKDLIPFVEQTLNAKKLFALHRTDKTVYGPLSREAIDQFHTVHVNRHLQTDIYVPFVESNSNRTLEVEPYDLVSSFA